MIWGACLCHATTMPPYAPDSDNDDTPEVVPLASSKKASRVQDNAVHAAERALRAKRKRDNQEKDRALKMAKVERQQQRQEQENPDEEDGDISAAPASKHLPDHLFSAAAASLSAPSSASQSRSARPKDKKGKKARRGGPKDVLVGCVRIVSSLFYLSSATGLERSASSRLPKRLPPHPAPSRRHALTNSLNPRFNSRKKILFLATSDCPPERIGNEDQVRNSVYIAS